MVYGPYPNLPVDDQESARLLVRDLERVDAPATPRPWGPFSSFFVGFFSLGALPALLWHDRFRDFVDEERQHLRRFAEWMRLHSTRPETMDLRVAGEDLGHRPLLSTLSVLSVLGVIVLFAAHLGGAGATAGDGRIVQRLLTWTYHFRSPGEWQPPLSTGQKLFLGWSIGLSVAYLFHWLQVRGHASDVRRFVRHANRVLRAGKVSGVPQPHGGFGFPWLIVAIFLAGRGAWWGVALALSGAAQQQYMSVASPRLRRALAARVREMAWLPGAGQASPHLTSAPRRRCPHVRCLALMPPGARFCPRCGHNVSPDGKSV